MDKEKILAESREENGYGEYDEKEKLMSINSQRLAFIVVAAMLILYVAFIDQTQYDAVAAILWSGIATANLYEAIKVKKPVSSIAGIAFTCIAIAHIFLFFVHRGV